MCFSYTYPINFVGKKGFCRRFEVQYNGSKNLPPDVNSSIGIYEYVGEKKDCTNCTAVYMLKREENVSLIRLFTRADDSPYTYGWYGGVS